MCKVLSCIHQMTVILELSSYQTEVWKVSLPVSWLLNDVMEKKHLHNKYLTTLCDLEVRP